MGTTRLKSNKQRMNIIENEDFELLHRGLTNDKKFLSKKYKYLFTVIHLITLQKVKQFFSKDLNPVKRNFDR